MSPDLMTDDALSDALSAELAKPEAKAVSARNEFKGRYEARDSAPPRLRELLVEYHFRHTRKKS